MGFAARCFVGEKVAVALVTGLSAKIHGWTEGAARTCVVDAEFFSVVLARARWIIRVGADELRIVCYFAAPITTLRCCLAADGRRIVVAVALIAGGVGGANILRLAPAAVGRSRTETFFGVVVEARAAGTRGSDLAHVDVRTPLALARRVAAERSAAVVPEGAARARGVGGAQSDVRAEVALVREGRTLADVGGEVEAAALS